MDLATLRYDVAYCEATEDESAVSWPIVGWFKARHGVLDCYMIPIVGLTCSGIQFFTWTQRFIRRLALQGFEEGWAFRRLDGLQAKASDYQDNIFRKLEIIQAMTTLIDPGCSVSIVTANGCWAGIVCGFGCNENNCAGMKIHQHQRDRCQRRHRRCHRKKIFDTI